MKTIGIQIKSNEIILVVLRKDESGIITQTKESSKFKVDDHNQQEQIKQFKNQVNSFFDSVDANKIGIVARNAKGKGLMSPSPVSFKLEGIIQLYEKTEIELVSKKTIDAYLKKNEKEITAEKILQNDSFDLAYYLIKN
ncbi:DUF3010 family protein [Chryseobacterium sp. MDT2-18]|uniref:DUF3010 family protein n=1 Tax=Chryseobacterium sp. MDT2-18 TaxID=1259136 RepID=UPI002789A15E|nr:DUF3010 family protein [Chryseobacterium sp. MDT2-18]MDQ0477100.1 hypothetical protein [Chryseobacterium sp. MDT2-18]